MKCPECRVEIDVEPEQKIVGQVAICKSCTQPIVWAGPIGYRKPSPFERDYLMRQMPIYNEIFNVMMGRSA